MSNRVETAGDIPGIKEIVSGLPAWMRNEAKATLDDTCLQIYNNWPGSVGTERIVEKLAFISERAPEYAKALKITNAEAWKILDDTRNVNRENWWQNANVPKLSDAIVVKDKEEFKKKFPSGKSVCPSCKSESSDYQECACGWKSYGLLSIDTTKVVFIGSVGEKGRIDMVQIFKPIELK